MLRSASSATGLIVTALTFEALAETPSTLITIPATAGLFTRTFVVDGLVAGREITGAAMGTFTIGGHLSGAFGLAFGPDGRLYVSSFGTNRVMRYDAVSGTFLSELDADPQPRNSLFNPNRRPV
jgi:hypothetical protein